MRWEYPPSKVGDCSTVRGKLYEAQCAARYRCGEFCYCHTRRITSATPHQVRQKQQGLRAHSGLVVVHRPLMLSGFHGVNGNAHNRLRCRAGAKQRTSAGVLTPMMQLMMPGKMCSTSAFSIFLVHCSPSRHTFFLATFDVNIIVYIINY